MNGGSVKKYRKGKSACAGCRYGTVVVTLWSSGVKNCRIQKSVLRGRPVTGRSDTSLQPNNSRPCFC
ncbi:hypothetical protein DM680_22595 [Salmonella enterica subsp. diarizonae]|nr:hypothetical protein [Salmonella enterica subsp. diarizonae]